MSGDVMQFPKTVEEFMEQYKIVDSEHVYTNGTELVPIFRMKQWFEHLRHGKWIYEPKDAIEMMHTKPKCSVCGYESADGMYYCSYCGARMDDDEISNIAKESADKISKALEKVRAKGMQKQNIKEDDEL